MPREHFDQELVRLKQDVFALSEMVAWSIHEAVTSLCSGDMEASARVIAGDRTINQKEREIAAVALALTATQQPMAGDMRLLASILSISSELERMGDYAKGIATVTQNIVWFSSLELNTELELMVQLALDMLNQAVQAFIREDLKAARTIPLLDNNVDLSYQRFYVLLFNNLAGYPTPFLDTTHYLLLVAHNLERIADRVTNICERTVFTVTGEITEFDRSQ